MDLYLQIVISLLLVLGAVFVILGLWGRRYQRGSGLIDIVAYRSLDPRKGTAVAVVKVGREMLFLGITQSEIRLLRTLRESDIQVPPQRRLDEGFRFLRLLREKLADEDN